MGLQASEDRAYSRRTKNGYFRLVNRPKRTEEYKKSVLPVGGGEPQFIPPKRKNKKSEGGTGAARHLEDHNTIRTSKSAKSGSEFMRGPV